MMDDDLHSSERPRSCDSGVYVLNARWKVGEGSREYRCSAVEEEWRAMRTAALAAFCLGAALLLRILQAQPSYLLFLYTTTVLSATSLLGFLRCLRHEEYAVAAQEEEERRATRRDAASFYVMEPPALAGVEE